jgi:hypothetical protein
MSAHTDFSLHSGWTAPVSGICSQKEPWAGHLPGASQDPVPEPYREGRLPTELFEWCFLLTHVARHLGASFTVKSSFLWIPQEGLPDTAPHPPPSVEPGSVLIRWRGEESVSGRSRACAKALWWEGAQ